MNKITKEEVKETIKAYKKRMLYDKPRTSIEAYFDTEQELMRLEASIARSPNPRAGMGEAGREVELLKAVLEHWYDEDE